MDQTAEADTEEGMSDRRNAGRLLKSLSKMWKAYVLFSLILFCTFSNILS